MRAIRVAEKIGGRGGDYGNVDVDFSILNCLVAAAMGAQHAHAAHLPLCAVVAQRPVHRAFDVMDDAFFHQFDGAFLGRERCAREPYQVLDADPGGRFQRHQRHFVAVAQMMMVRDHHAVAKSALAQRRLQIGHALVAAIGVVFVRADRRRRLAPARLILSHTRERSLRLAVCHRRHGASRRILREFYSFFRVFSPTHEIAPIAFARATSFSARCTTGGSIIFEPRLTTASPLLCASSKAATTFFAFSISSGVG